MKEEDFRKTFVKNLKYWLKIKNKTQMDIMNDLGLSSSTVSDWCNAKKYPRMGTVQMLADYFGIKKSDLIEERKHNSNNKIIDIMIEELEKLKNRESRARKREEFIYVLPEIEVILPSEKIKGVQSVKIKLKNSAKKEILIYPISIDFKDNLLYIALSADKAKMVQDGKEFLINGKDITIKELLESSE